MGDSGFARSIAKSIVKKLGKDKALLSVVLPGSILTFGGVSLFVVVFSIYPFAAALYKETGIPKRFIPGANRHRCIYSHVRSISWVTTDSKYHSSHFFRLYNLCKPRYRHHYRHSSLASKQLASITPPKVFT